MSEEAELSDALAPSIFDAPPPDPESQSVVTDFLDYTEYLPSDLFRSLSLIGNLDKAYQDAAAKVHELTTLYGNLPTLPANERPDAQTLRREISLALDKASSSREASYTEADRLYKLVDRHASRLTSIKAKLHALPRPPSRDPTPPPQPVSPQITRAKKADLERTPKLKLTLDGNKNRKRKLVVPGEVLPPPDLAEGYVSGGSDELGASPKTSRSVEFVGDGGIKQKKWPKEQKQKTPKPPKIRPPGSMGTNVHSVVAGISTSNALALLTPPPVDAKPGSKYRPWFKLTEYEMASLRKTMKKNAIWTPSDAMIRRELTRDNRGLEAYEKAKAAAAKSGVPLIDEDPSVPGKTVLAPGEVSWTQQTGPDEDALVSRGMRLNEAKKHKIARERAEAEAEQAEQAEQDEQADREEAKPEKPKPQQPKPDESESDESEPDEMELDETSRDEAERDAMELDEANRKIAAAGDQFKTLFSRDKPAPALGSTPIAGKEIKIKTESTKLSKKRKRSSEKEVVTRELPVLSIPTPDSSKQAGPKKLKISVPPSIKITLKTTPKRGTKSTSPVKSVAVTKTTIVPLAPAGPSSSPKSTASKRAPSSTAETPGTTPEPKKATAPAVATAAQSRSRRTSVPPKPAPAIDTPIPTATKKAAYKDIKETPATQPKGNRTTETRAASAEPAPSKRELRGDIRRASVVASTAPTTPILAPRATRSGRRPAPGFVTADEDGQSKVSVGKRKAAPKKKGSAGQRKDEQRKNGDRQSEAGDEAFEEVDPDEPRYCVCGDVSYGTMIACSNEADCEKEWFHLECVGLLEIPPRRSKWYCLDCRKKLGTDEKGNVRAPEIQSGRRR